MRAMRKKPRLTCALLTPVVLALLLATTSAASAAEPPSPGPAPGRCETQTFGSLSVPGAVITSIVAAPNPGGTVSSPALVAPPAPPATDVPAFCEVTVTLTHGTGLTSGAPADAVHVWIWLPIEGWNGRFQGTAGGGNAASLGANALAAAIKLGYAAAATDAGHALDVVSAAWVLNPDRSVNQQLSVNFAYLSIHDMTVVGKAATARYYGRSASYSYFNGCSTGGRQGMGQAQRYPDDYDGILSGAPALYVPQLAISLIWPQVVQNVAGGVLPVCKLAAFTQAAIAACDPLDGLTDGLISDVPDCHFDPSTLVGTETDCGPITEADADVVRKIHDGPTGSGGQSLWWGLTPGTNLTSVAQPAFADIIAYSVLNDPTFDWHSITEESLASYYDLAVSKMSEISTSNPDLRGFRDSGGKLVLWHGLADQLIPPQGTVWYYEQARTVLAAEGGSQPEDFARLFLAPGVAHCQGGYGPAPANADVLAALVNWVENGTPPDRLDGVQRDASGAVVRTRPLCPYPQVAVYNGQGDPNSAASFNCAAAA